MALRITYVGHATVLVDMDGVRLLTDPVLRSRVLHLRRVGRGSRLGAARPRRRARLARRTGITSTCRRSNGSGGSCRSSARAASAGSCGGGSSATSSRSTRASASRSAALSVTATFAEHDGARGPLGAQAPSLGYAIEGSRRVYFAGDTDLFDGMADLGAVDLALVPVAGWGSKVGPGHLDPERSGRGGRAAAAEGRDPHPLGHVLDAQPAADARARRRVRRARGRERVPDVEVRIVEPRRRSSSTRTSSRRGCGRSGPRARFQTKSRARRRAP